MENNKAIVRSFLEKTNQKGRTQKEMCTSSFTAHIGALPEMNLQAFEQYQQAYFASFSDSGITIEDMVAEGNRVAFRGKVHAIHTATFMGIPASGKQIVVPVIGFAQLAEGKIAKWWNSPDRLSWMQQIGALPEVSKTTQ